MESEVKFRFAPSSVLMNRGYILEFHDQIQPVVPPGMKTSAGILLFFSSFPERSCNLFSWFSSSRSPLFKTGPTLPFRVINQHARIFRFFFHATHICPCRHRPFIFYHSVLQVLVPAFRCLPYRMISLYSWARLSGKLGTSPLFLSFIPKKLFGCLATHKWRRIDPNDIKMIISLLWVPGHPVSGHPRNPPHPFTKQFYDDSPRHFFLGRELFSLISFPPLYFFCSPNYLFF